MEITGIDITNSLLPVKNVAFTENSRKRNKMYRTQTGERNYQAKRYY